MIFHWERLTGLLLQLQLVDVEPTAGNRISLSYSKKSNSSRAALIKMGGNYACYVLVYCLWLFTVQEEPERDLPSKFAQLVCGLPPLQLYTHDLRYCTLWHKPLAHRKVHLVNR